MNNNIYDMAVTFRDLKKAFDKLYEANETFDTIICALQGDKLPIKGQQFLCRLEKVASICRETMDMIAVEMDEIE